MFDSALIQVAIVLGLLYTVLSLVCTSLTEAASSLVALRARTLAMAIASLLDKDGKSAGNPIVKALLDHPLIRGLRRPRRFLGRTASPEYIPSGHFARALLDLLPRSGDERVGSGIPEDLAQLQKRLEAFPAGHVQRALMCLLAGAKDLPEVIPRIEDWYNQTMDRARGWYARRAQAVTFAFALILTLSVNADTLMISRIVWEDADLRAVLVAQAEALSERGIGPEAAEGDDGGVEGQAAKADAIKQEVEATLTGFPLGWDQEQGWPDGRRDRASKILGLLVTAFAVSLGAPFWFDLLNRMVNLRSSGQPIPTARDMEKEAKQQAG